jgi:uncharacterized tellurite resistance protein B-like protein
MSVIDKVLQGERGEAPELTLREAGAAILVGAVAADGAIGAEEGMRLTMLLRSMRLYRDVPEEHVRHLVERAVTRVEQRGFETVLGEAAMVIPDELRPALFALAVELVFADGRIAEREKQFVDVLQSTLAIPDELAVKIVEVQLVRSRA